MARYGLVIVDERGGRLASVSWVETGVGEVIDNDGSCVVSPSVPVASSHFSLRISSPPILSDL